RPAHHRQAEWALYLAGAASASDRSDPAGGHGRAGPGHVVRSGLLLCAISARRWRAPLADPLAGIAPLTDTALQERERPGDLASASGTRASAGSLPYRRRRALYE